MNTLGRFEYEIRGYECGPEGCASLATVVNLLQEAAGVQARESGFSKLDFDAEGENISWIITRFHLKLYRYPRWWDRVEILTWPCGGRKVVAERDFEIRIKGEKIGVATSEWMLINLATRKLVAIPPRVYSLANDERPRAMPGHAYSKLRWDCRDMSPDVQRFKARRGDLDINNHVNNVHYVEWLMEALPAGKVTEFEIAYKSETLAGSEVVAEAVETEPGIYTAHVASPDGHDHAVARLLVVG